MSPFHVLARAGPLALAALLLLAPASSAQPVVSVNFVADAGPNPGGMLNLTDLAGVVPRTNWNNVSAVNGTTNNLVNGVGVMTPATVTIANSPNTWSIPASQLPATPDGTMMQGYVDTNATSITSITVSGLSAAGFTGTYDVYVYGVGDSNANRSGDYTIGAQSFRMVDDQQFNGTFRQSTAPGGSGAGQSGNYVRFTGLSGDSFLLTAQATQDLAGFRAPVNGLQIIGTTPVPEPGGLALLGLAAAATLARALGRRRHDLVAADRRAEPA